MSEKKIEKGDIVLFKPTNKLCYIKNKYKDFKDRDNFILYDIDGKSYGTSYVNGLLKVRL